MTPWAIRPRTGVLGALLLFALAGGLARAGELYQWETEDGRIEIGTHPPLGAAAKLWNPGQEVVERSLPPAPPPPEKKAVGERAKAAQRAAMGRLGNACLSRKHTIEKAGQKIAITERRIGQREKRLEELEATALAYSRTSCRPNDDDGIDTSDCLASTFHRDAEIARVQRELEELQQKLADLEQRARAAEEDPSCTPTAAAPAK